MLSIVKHAVTLMAYSLKMFLQENREHPFQFLSLSEVGRKWGMRTNRARPLYQPNAGAPLPRAWRAAFILHHVEGLTIPEVAHRTDTTEDEGKCALLYAREFLRQTCLEADLAELPEDRGAVQRFLSTAADVDVPAALSESITVRLR
jgi:hypothetical protein